MRWKRKGFRQNSENGNKLDSYDWNMTVISKDGLVTEEDYDDYDEGEDD